MSCLHGLASGSEFGICLVLLISLLGTLSSGKDIKMNLTPYSKLRSIYN